MKKYSDFSRDELIELIEDLDVDLILCSKNMTDSIEEIEKLKADIKKLDVPRDLSGFADDDGYRPDVEY